MMYLPYAKIRRALADPGKNGDAWFEYPGGMVCSRAHGRHDSETVERFRAMAGALLAAIAYDERRHALEAVSHDG